VVVQELVVEVGLTVQVTLLLVAVVEVVEVSLITNLMLQYLLQLVLLLEPEEWVEQQLLLL
jgi:hypothetical protein